MSVGRIDHGQHWFITFMEEAGYKRNPEGMCLGMAQVAKQFLLAGKVDYFNHLINFLYQTSKAADEVAVADYSDEAQAAFHKKIDALQEDAKVLGIKDLKMEIQALLDAVGLYYNPQDYPHLLGEHPSRGQFHYEVDSLLTSSMVAEAGGIFNGYERVLISDKKVDEKTVVPVNALLLEVDAEQGIVTNIFWKKNTMRIEVALDPHEGKNLFLKLSMPNQDNELVNDIKQKIERMEVIAEDDRPVGFSSFRGDYNDDELQAYFSTLEESVTAASVVDPIVLLLGSKDHAITVAYFPLSRDWYLVDANNLPAVSLSRDDLVPAIFNAFFVPDEQDSFLMETSLFSLSGKESKLERAIIPWQKNNAPIHDVSEMMMFAALGGNIPDVEKLVQQGADVNYKDTNENTALRYAICNNHLAMVKKLIELGVEIRSEDVKFSINQRCEMITKILKFAQHKQLLFRHSPPDKQGNHLKPPQNK